MSDVPTRLLRETLRTRLTPASSSGCIDTETLAAWSDDTLSAREREAAESHAAGCGRCQALLAAMARTTPPAPRRAWWRSPAVGWLIPLTAAAVAVGVWINIPTPRLGPSAASAPHAVDSTSPTAGPANRSSGQTSAQRPSVTSALPSVSDDRAAESKTAARATVPPPPPAAVAPQREARADERHAAAAADASRRAFRYPTPAEVAPMDARDTAPATSSAKPVPAPPAPPQSAAAQAAPGSNAAAAPIAAPKPSPRSSGVSDRAASRLRAETLAKASLIPSEIVSPNVKVRWRIPAAGSVDRSIDGGMTWQTQSTGVPATLTAGTAPSPTICWLVGPGGIIVLSTDGRTWQRVPFPEAIDLASIRASDEVNATVTTADGRTFVTTDGGKTWRLSGAL
jgi:hypothetical protein